MNHKQYSLFDSHSSYNFILFYVHFFQSEFRNKHYDITFCSFALHLVSESRLVPFCQQLALLTDWLVVISPHKRPHIDSKMGFILK
jgi:hypothetical protein